MGVGVAAVRIVDGKVGTHSRIDKLRFHILADKSNVLFPRQFMGQAISIFFCKPGIFRFFDFLHRAAQNRPVRKSGGAWPGSKISVWTTPSLRV